MYVSSGINYKILTKTFNATFRKRTTVCIIICLSVYLCVLSTVFIVNKKVICALLNFNFLSLFVSRYKLVLYISI